MKRPRKAIVLAAGFGKRLSPVTAFCPKPLVPLRGKPIILHQLELLQSWGVKEVLVNLHHLAEILVAELPGLCPSGLKLNFSFEAEILGTGGGLRRMAWFVGEDPVWVCNADVLQRLNPKPLLEAWEKQKPFACLWMVAGKGPQSVKVEKGDVVDFRGGGMTFSGLHLLNRRTLDFLPERDFSSVIEAYDKILAEGGKILGVEVPGSEWADVGTPEQLLTAEGKAVVFPGVRLGKAQKAEGLVVPPAWGLTKKEQKALPEVQAVGLLAERGSDRSFRRLYFPGHTEILIQSGETRPENFRFAGHTRFLAGRGIRVPKILQSREKNRWLRVEDLGSEHLLDRLQSGSAVRNRHDMRGVLQSVAKLHALKIPAGFPLEKPFDLKLYAWERELFEKEYVKRYGEHSEVRKMKKLLFRIPEILGRQPQVLVHRDLQSTNLMLVVDRGRPAPAEGKVSEVAGAGRPRSDLKEWAFIDYQGMRMGAAAYDLGSLLADPYVKRPVEVQLELLAVYNHFAADPVSAELYAAGAVQRLLQALGAYARLGALKGNQRFLGHIPAALAQLDIWSARFCEGQRAGNPLRGGSP